MLLLCSNHHVIISDTCLQHGCHYWCCQCHCLCFQNVVAATLVCDMDAAATAATAQKCCCSNPCLLFEHRCCCQYCLFTMNSMTILQWWHFSCDMDTIVNVAIVQPYYSRDCGNPCMDVAIDAASSTPTIAATILVQQHFWILPSTHCAHNVPTNANPTIALIYNANAPINPFTFCGNVHDRKCIGWWANCWIIVTCMHVLFFAALPPLHPQIS